MKISLNWLKEFVDAPAGPAELKAALTGLGLGVEVFTPAGDDIVFEIEVTTNRPDCLSHLGVAREIAALYCKPLRLPRFQLQESDTAARSEVTIEISDPDLCARYCGRVIRNVNVERSPEWLARRLESVGVRSINNVADATNYVLMELGQPLHAFDLARLRESRIIVRRARPGEHLRTLDGVDHTLTSDNLVIADGKLPVALAGVMGGEESEISPATTSVLLESAWFEPVSIRRTAKAHGMHTEASHHFERGADIEVAPFAADRAAAMIAELTGGEVLANLLDVYPRPYSGVRLVLRSREILRILGTEIPGPEAERILRALGFEVQGKQECSWGVRPPSWRPDVTREVDLIEEIARVYGYDRLPSRVRPAPPRVERDTLREKELAISGRLVSLGYRETISSSMVDPAEAGTFTQRPPVQLLNPLSQEASAMRSTSIPSMLRSLRWNLDRGQMDLRLFEVGKIYTPTAKGSLPEERRVLTLGLAGNLRLGYLPVPDAEGSSHDSDRPLNFYDVKGDLEELLESFELPAPTFEAADGQYFQKGRAGRFCAGGKLLAVLGQLRDSIARDYKLRQAPWLAEVELDTLLDTPLRSPHFAPYSRFPAVERDLSLVVSERVTYRELEQAALKPAQAMIQNITPVDIFRGGSLAPEHYSVLLRVTFHSLSHTLTRAEVDEAIRQILMSLTELGVQLRG
jgi:phenylalanyl-tRNA synthetase beta chain